MTVATQPTLAECLSAVLTVAGSDLLISAGTPPRVRRDGVLEPLFQATDSLTPHDTELMVREALGIDQWEQLVRDRSLDFAFTFQDRVRMRGNAYFQRGSVAGAFRVLPLQIPGFEHLGVPESVQELIGRRQGLVLVTGPTGSGKSTTQAAMIDHINRTRACHIVTIEDPIEYVHRHQNAIVDQRQVGSDVGTFADALRAVFREDPDVVLIGEMRDLETISSALTIAETGHLVLATLHTNDSAQAIDRILDGFPAAHQQQVRIQLAACLAGVIYQQLLPVIGGGRVAAFEVLVATTGIKALIKEGKTNQIRNAVQTGLRDGSQTLERSLSELLRSGMISEREARTRSLYPQEVAF